MASARRSRSSGPSRVLSTDLEIAASKSSICAACNLTRRLPMFAFLKRTFVILLGFLLIVVFIWFAGPYFAFGSYRPLETTTARLIAIAFVVGCWLVSKLVKRLRSFRASDRLIAAVVAQPQPQTEKAR